MTAATAVRVVGMEMRGPVLGSLEDVARAKAPDGVEGRIAELRALCETDLAGIEADLEAIESQPTPMHRSAHHLLALGGKRLRPMCVALASRVGTGFSQTARDLAVAAELVHNATLLHDDVVDLGDRRRGAPAARVLYGNAASIYAGDWLLVEALMRVRRAGMPDLLDKALGVLAEMLAAEALQLARRGRVDTTLDDYMTVVRGKTASLFRWALFSGGRAGGLSESSCLQLETYGEKLGVAFQVVDDTLDVDGEAESLGKELFADLREGKTTYPLLVALERQPELRADLAARMSDGVATLDDVTARRAVVAMRETGAIEEARKLADVLVSEAVDSLNGLPDVSARRALSAVAEVVVARRK
jgi:octaprenyl-diphosphate synthase